jgi:hypothetical protein
VSVKRNRWFAVGSSEGTGPFVAARAADSALVGDDPKLLLGLQDRIDALGGDITVHSPPGGGTTLQIELRLDRASTPH